ncbi:MAG: OadG family transporter subunit [Evtepia sp.]
MTILTAGLGEHLPVGEAAVLALLGYVVAFFGIVLLMAVVMAMGRVFIARDKKAAAIKEAAHAAAQAAAAAAPAAPKPVAPGTAGELKLHDVEPRTAAMLMAIVADKMGKPLNELRFISIKEVK